MRRMARALAVLTLATPALAGSLGYGFLGYQGGFQGGGGGFGTFHGLALGGEAWGGPWGRGGALMVGPWLSLGKGFYLLPGLGLGGGEVGQQGGFLLDLGVRAFRFLGPEGGWAVGLGAGYTYSPAFPGGFYLRLLLGGGRP
ncbi:hypothetical protein Thermus77420_17060 [Thermus thalpophilus]